VEAAAAVQAAGPQEDPAAQNVHTAISAARRVTRQVNKNARSPAVMVGNLVVSPDACAPPERVICV